MVDRVRGQNIIISDPTLEADLGLWLDIILLNHTYVGELNDYYYIPSDRESLIGMLAKDRRYASDQSFPCAMIASINIKERLAHLLDRFGVNDSDICVLDNYNEKDKSFDCHVGEQRCIKITLTDRDIFQHKQIIEFEDDKTAKAFEYVSHGIQTNGFEMHLESYDQINGNRRIHRYLSDLIYYVRLNVGNKYIYIQIDYPSKLKDKNNNTYFLNENLENELFNLDIDTPIAEIYKFVVRSITGLGSTMDSYSNIHISKGITKDNSLLSESITDRIDIKSGNLETFKYSNEKRTVSINSDGEWSVESIDHEVHSDKSGKIDLKIYSTNVESIDKMRSPKELVDSATAFAGNAYVLSHEMIENAKKGLC